MSIYVLSIQYFFLFSFNIQLIDRAHAITHCNSVLENKVLYIFNGQPAPAINKIKCHRMCYLKDENYLSGNKFINSYAENVFYEGEKNFFIRKLLGNKIQNYNGDEKQVTGAMRESFLGENFEDGYYEKNNLFHKNNVRNYFNDSKQRYSTKMWGGNKITRRKREIFGNLKIIKLKSLYTSITYNKRYKKQQLLLKTYKSMGSILLYHTKWSLRGAKRFLGRSNTRKFASRRTRIVGKFYSRCCLSRKFNTRKFHTRRHISKNIITPNNVSKKLFSRTYSRGSFAKKIRTNNGTRNKRAGFRWTCFSQRTYTRKFYSRGSYKRRISCRFVKFTRKFRKKSAARNFTFTKKVKLIRFHSKYKKKFSRYTGTRNKHWRVRISRNRKLKKSDRYETIRKFVKFSTVRYTRRKHSIRALFTRRKRKTVFNLIKTKKRFFSFKTIRRYTRKSYTKKACSMIRRRVSRTAERSTKNYTGRRKGRVSRPSRFRRTVRSYGTNRKSNKPYTKRKGTCRMKTRFKNKIFITKKLLLKTRKKSLSRTTNYTKGEYRYTLDVIKRRRGQIITITV